MDAYEQYSCICGYHIYQEIWTAAVGETLVCERETNNNQDRYAVAVKRNGTTVGHLPRKASRVCSLFLRRGGSIHCTVTGRRRHFSDLPQGGLEVPCKIMFTAESEEIKKLKILLKTNNA